jgi:short-subunit dehydrogenase
MAWPCTLRAARLEKRQIAQMIPVPNSSFRSSSGLINARCRSSDAEGEGWHFFRSTEEMNNQTALITGASSGIGLQLARELARRGHPLVLVAPIDSELESIAEQLENEFGVSVDFFARDLTEEFAATEIFEELQSQEVEVEILVNNAGFGQRGKFWEIPLDLQLNMVRLNVEAVVKLTHAFLAPMVERGHGRILNTASVAGFEAGPMLAVYHATKAFVLSFSEALARELKDTGVSLTALCPGPVDTDFFPKAEMVETKAFQKANLMAPQEVAKAGIEALFSGEMLIIPGGINKAMIFSRRFLTEGAQAKMNEKMYEEVSPEDHQREPGEIAAKYKEP